MACRARGAGAGADELAARLDLTFDERELGRRHFIQRINQLIDSIARRVDLPLNLGTLLRTTSRAFGYT